jgi:phosphoenolpyruvate carboxykinase (GTP)
MADAPAGVPITAIVFGGRRRTLAPLVYQARDWAHGVLVGAGMASETTAAATGKVGVVRRDPMAMKPFAGYNFGDYWNHWFTIGDRVPQLPGIFHVNWFRRDAQGKFLWPGYGENLRVLAWIIARSTGKAGAVDTPIGAVPRRDSLDLGGLALDNATVAELLAVDTAAWRQEAAEIGRYFETFGARLPERLRHQLDLLNARLAYQGTHPLQG